MKIENYKKILILHLVIRKYEFSKRKLCLKIKIHERAKIYVLLYVNKDT